MRIRLFDPAANPRFDDLPWATALEDWDHPRLVDMPVGLHRHIVRFVEYDGQFFALKELPQRLADREYRLLRTMNDRGLPVVAAVALVDRRGEPDPVLITRYLHYAVPFRLLVAEQADGDVAERVIESIAMLLARLHTAGFSWGDCSLSNALFRRDELHLSGYALDTETGELHDRLTDGQRRFDIETAIVNIAGGLADLAAAGQLPPDVDPFEIAPQVATLYDEVWEELHGASIYDPADPRTVDQRLERLHDLGFGVSEAIITDTDEPNSFSFLPAAIAGGYHRRELAELTGISAREHQAHRLVEHIKSFRSQLPTNLSLRDVGHQWLADVYDPVLATVPRAAAGKLERPQLFIEILDHFARIRGGQTSSDGVAVVRSAALVAAARSYADDVLANRTNERTSSAREGDPEIPPG